MLKVKKYSIPFRVYIPIKTGGIVKKQWASILTKTFEHSQRGLKDKEKAPTMMSGLFKYVKNDLLFNHFSFLDSGRFTSSFS